MKKIIIAIDATSIVNTGGFTHLYNLIENFDNKEVAKIGISVGYTIPKLRTEKRQLEVILFSAG